MCASVAVDDSPSVTDEVSLALWLRVSVTVPLSVTVGSSVRVCVPVAEKVCWVTDIRCVVD